MGQQPGMGMGGSPSAFTSPGMDPTMLALLMRMQNAGGGAGGMPGGGAGIAPQFPSAPAGGGGGGMGMPVAPLGAGPQQGNPFLAQLMQNPQMLQRIMQMLGGGGSAGGLFGGSGGPGGPLVGGASGYPGGNPIY